MNGGKGPLPCPSISVAIASGEVGILAGVILGVSLNLVDGHRNATYLEHEEGALDILPKVGMTTLQVSAL